MYKAINPRLAPLLFDIGVKRNDGKVLEIEAGAGEYVSKTDVKENFSGAIPYRQYVRLKTYLETKGQTYNPTEERGTDYRSGDIRRRVIDSGSGVGAKSIEIWQRKYLARGLNNEMLSMDFREYGWRWRFSWEETIAPVRDFVPNIKRTRQRYSYMVNSYCRVDLSEVTMEENQKTQSIRHELEIEYLGDYAHLNELEKTILWAFKILHATENVYSLTERTIMMQSVASALGHTNGRGHFNPKALVQVRTLKNKDLVYGGLVGGKITYTATWKVDGQRGLLVIAPNGIWLIFPPNEYNFVYKVTMRGPRFAGGTGGLAGTVIDGEIVPKAGRKAGAPDTPIWFLAFDVLSNAGNPDIQTIKSHKTRLSTIEPILAILSNGIITAGIKDFVSLRSVNDFYLQMRRFFSVRNRLLFEEDGIIFTPEETEYNPHSERYRQEERILTQHPDIVKWKDVEKLTIDFSINRISPTTVELESGQDGRLVTFTGDRYNPFDTKTQVETGAIIKSGLPNGTIVEFGWNTQTHKFVMQRVRYDKPNPNPLIIALDNWRHIHDPVNAETLMGQDFVMVFKYHNRIKRALLRQLPPGLTLLDLGSGIGGTAHSWRPFSHIFAVEPNKTYLPELQRRLALEELTNKVTVINTGAEDTKSIVAQVKSRYPTGVDVVSLMLSMSFFWKDATIFEGFIETIRGCLKPDGYIVFLTIDGDAVEQMFTPTYGNLTNNGDFKTAEWQELNLGPATIKYPEQKFRSGVGSKMYINISGSNLVLDQEEYLVRLQDFYQRLGLSMNDSPIYRAETEKFLSIAGMAFSRLYSFSIIKRGNPIILRQEDEPKSTEPDENIGDSLPVLPKVVKYSQALKEQVVTPDVAPYLPAKGDDAVIPLKSSWRSGLVRIATLSEGDSLLHAMAKASIQSYQNNAGYNSRVQFIQQLRQELALTLEVEVKVGTNITNWEVSDYGSFIRALSRELVNPSLIGSWAVDYSIPGLERLFNSYAPLPSTMYRYISDILNVDLYLFNGTVSDLNFDSTTARVGSQRNCLLLCATGVAGRIHYEVIGEHIVTDTNNGTGVISTIFPYDSKLMNQVRDLEGARGLPVPPNYTPDKAFISIVGEVFSNAYTTELKVPNLDQLTHNGSNPFRDRYEQLKSEIVTSVNTIRAEKQLQANGKVSSISSTLSSYL